MWGLQMENWTLGIIIGIAAMLMHRLDRLGKQLEAVSAMIRADVSHTEEEGNEILQEWKENKKQAAKDERQFWVFWFVVIAALGLYLNYFRAH
jgi:hypothetical protein